MMIKILFSLFLALISTELTAAELRIIVPSNDDSYNINARLLAKHYVKHLPENTNIIIQAMPGAASLVAANYLYNVAPRDGTVIGTFYKAIPMTGVIGGPTVQFDPRKFTWIGSTADGRKDTVIMWSNRPDDLAEYRTEQLLVGIESSVSADSARLIKDSLKLNFKPIPGYPTTGAARLALERREVDAVIFSLIGIKTQKPGWLQPNSGIKAILQFGNGTRRHHDYQQVPTVAELMTNPDDLEMLKVFESQFVLLRPFVAPPGIPEEKARMLREAFTKTVQDPEYQREARSVGIDVDLIDWREAEEIVAATANAPQRVINNLRELQRIQ